MNFEIAKLWDIFAALAAGGAITMAIKLVMDRSKNNAEAKKIAVDGQVAIVEIAMKMADKLQASLKVLEDKTQDLERRNLKLEHELSELRISNINLLREVEALKRQNEDLERTCGVLVRENTHLKVELENCIKKEA